MWIPFVEIRATTSMRRSTRVADSRSVLRLCGPKAAKKAGTDGPESCHHVSKTAGDETAACFNIYLSGRA